METQAFLYKTNGEIIPVLPQNKEYFTLEELQKFVGGYIQNVYLIDGRIMCVNEEGKLLDMPYNDQATDLMRNSGHDDDYIVGDCVVMPRSFML